MCNRKCGCKNPCNCVGQYAVAFGLGLAASCFCPMGLILFIVAVILVVLGISLLRH